MHVWGKAKEHNGASQMATCQHGWRTTHMREARAHNKHTWRAACRSLTSCRFRRDPDASVEHGARTQRRLLRGAHASIAGQHHKSEQEGAQHTPHAGTQAIHSPAAESGGIQMHVWGRAKEHNAGWSEGEHARLGSEQQTRGQQGHTWITTWREASRSLTRCRIRRDPDACVG
jgi:hypothetical protein